MSEAPPTRRRWFQFGVGTDDRTDTDIEASLNSGRVDDTGASSVERRVTHTIEDVLVGIAIMTLAFDDRFPRSVVRDVVRELMEARQDGRASELVAGARQEADALPDWECEQCHEANPGTFETCWNCSGSQPPDCTGPSKESQIILGIESARTLRFTRESDAAIQPDVQPEDEYQENHPQSAR